MTTASKGPPTKRQQMRSVEMASFSLGDLVDSASPQIDVAHSRARQYYFLDAYAKYILIARSHRLHGAIVIFHRHSQCVNFVGHSGPSASGTLVDRRRALRLLGRKRLNEFLRRGAFQVFRHARRTDGMAPMRRLISRLTKYDLAPVSLFNSSLFTVFL